GLSIVKEIIDKHGARIELISHRGEGTQVIIRL
ncbi:MAG TPA: ATP-binding protein, partial [Clostridiaceae bacterium]|nr:ATP-binding protein [Clostridiaceae bacterium]